MQTFDFVHAQNAPHWIVEKPAHTVDSALALGDGGYVAYLADSRETVDPTSGQAISGNVSVHLPAGPYLASFYSPTTGQFSPAVPISGDDKPVVLPLGPFKHDIVLRVTRAH
jgi:hypothetical protein